MLTRPATITTRLSLGEHRARVSAKAQELNAAIAYAHAEGHQPWITVIVGDVERPYTYIGRVAVLPGEDA